MKGALKMAKLYFRYGAMNSGKSTALIQVAHNYEERGQKAIILKPSIDTKSDKVISRIGAEKQVDIHITPETSIQTEIDTLLPNHNVHCILVDEVQFLSTQQIDELFLIAINMNIPVIGYGIRVDFLTHSFPGSQRMMELSHSIEEMKTICRCGKKAILNGRKINQRFVKKGSQIAIDGESFEYESLCGKCYIEEIGLP